MTDDEIARRLRKKDEEIFDYLMLQYNKLLWAIVGNILGAVGTSEDIEDCISDIYIKLLENPKCYDPKKGSLKSFLARVGKNMAIDKYRKLTKNTVISLQEYEWDDGNISVIDYQKETKTAFLMITSLGDDHKGQVTLTINNFMTGREFFEDLPEEAVHMDQVISEHTAETMTQASIWKQGGSGDTDRYQQSDLLIVDELAIPFLNTDKFTISNAGFVDGQFHLQIKTVLGGEELYAGYYISAKFADEQEDVTYEPTASIHFITDRKYAYSEAAKEPHANYTELIYPDITSVEQLQGLSMGIDYMKTPHISEGTWEFAFTVPEKVATAYPIKVELPINGENMFIEELAISPLGITVTLPTTLAEEYKHRDSVCVLYDDGRSKVLDQSSIYTYEGISTIVFGGQVIELEGIQSILVNGVSVDDVVPLMSFQIPLIRE